MTLKVASWSFQMPCECALCATWNVWQDSILQQDPPPDKDPRYIPDNPFIRGLTRELAALKRVARAWGCQHVVAYEVFPLQRKAKIVGEYRCMDNL